MDELIPLVAISMPFLMVIAIVVIPAYLRSRERAEMQATIRAAIEKGQALPPEFIDALSKDNASKPTSSAQRDLRSGVIWLAVGIGLAVFGSIISLHEQEAFHPMLGVATIPAVVGVALIVLSFLNPNKAKG